MVSRFFRANYTQVKITLSANESLGTPDPNYLQDYNGNDGRLSLLHAQSAIRYPLLMTEVVSETPQTPHDVFRGFFLLAGKPDGLYWLQGRLRDVAGNYTILGAFANPSGGEAIAAVGIEILTFYEGVRRPRAQVTYRPMPTAQVVCRDRVKVAVLIR
jgi:hypothetical protein